MKSLACVAAVLCAAPVFAASITVEAGDYDRRDCVVEFKLPPGQFNSVWPREGGSLPLQVKDGAGAFILAELKHGEKRTYTLDSTRDKARPRAVAKLSYPSTSQVVLIIENKPVLTYRTEKTELPPDRPDFKPIFQR